VDVESSLGKLPTQAANRARKRPDANALSKQTCQCPETDVPQTFDLRIARHAAINATQKFTILFTPKQPAIKCALPFQQSAIAAGDMVC